MDKFLERVPDLVIDPFSNSSLCDFTKFLTSADKCNRLSGKNRQTPDFVIDKLFLISR